MQIFERPFVTAPRRTRRFHPAGKLETGGQRIGVEVADGQETRRERSYAMGHGQTQLSDVSYQLSALGLLSSFQFPVSSSSSQFPVPSARKSRLGTSAVVRLDRHWH